MKPKNLKIVTQLMHQMVDIHASIQGVCVDSRLAKPNDLFFALPGAQTDGHAFIPEAASKGISAAVVKKNYELTHGNLPLIYVDDPLITLQLLAKEMLKRSKSKVVAVTGSVGKTTTKDFITTLLRSQFRVASSPGNHNSQIGLPLAIINHTDGNEDVVVLEMGMTQAGNITQLVDIAVPNIAVLTTVALAHAGYFNSLEEIAQAKAEIFSHPETKWGIVDRDFLQMCSIGQCEKVSFSIRDPEADYFLCPKEEASTVFERKLQQQLPLLNLPGEHNLHNYLAAVATARLLGLSWESIATMQEFLKLPERRLEIVQKNGVIFVNDSYNASEKTIKAALCSMPAVSSNGKRIAVLGEMVELGKFSEGCHREVGKYALQHLDRMICMGKECWPIVEEWKAAGKDVDWKMSRSEILDLLRIELKSGDVVLLKGACMNQLWKILEEF